MSSNGKSDQEKLGHDPLEWLGEEPLDEETEDSLAENTSDDSSLDEVSNETESEPLADQGSEASDNNRYLLPEKLGVQIIEAAVAELKQKLDAGDNDKPFEIDAEEAVAVESCGYQLLLSIAKTCDENKRPLRILNVGQSVMEQLSLLGDQRIKSIIKDSMDAAA